MKNSEFTSWLFLIIITFLWCTLHSLLITNKVISYFKNILGTRFRYYRLFYNIFSFLTFIPVIYYEYLIRLEIIFKWDGYCRVIQIVLLGTALLLFYFGCQQYSGKEFLGIKQIKNSKLNKTLSETGKLNTSGILQVTRHPWYLGVIFFIWARNLTVSIIIINLVFTFYLIIGTYLEERKLIEEFGDKYIEYQKKVSMLIPFKWIKSKFK